MNELDEIRLREVQRSNFTFQNNLEIEDLLKRCRESLEMTCSDAGNSVYTDMDFRGSGLRINKLKDGRPVIVGYTVLSHQVFMATLDFPSPVKEATKRYFPDDLAKKIGIDYNNLKDMK